MYIAMQTAIGDLFFAGGGGARGTWRRPIPRSALGFWSFMSGLMLWQLLFMILQDGSTLRSEVSKILVSNFWIMIVLPPSKNTHIYIYIYMYISLYLYVYIYIQDCFVLWCDFMWFPLCKTLGVKRAFSWKLLRPCLDHPHTLSTPLRTPWPFSPVRPLDENQRHAFEACCLVRSWLNAETKGLGLLAAGAGWSFRRDGDQNDKKNMSQRFFPDIVLVRKLYVNIFIDDIDFIFSVKNTTCRTGMLVIDYCVCARCHEKVFFLSFPKKSTYHMQKWSPPILLFSAAGA